MPDKDNFWGGKALADQIRGRYGEGQQDYYLEPLVLVDSEGSPLGRIQMGMEPSSAAAGASANFSSPKPSPILILITLIVQRWETCIL